MFGFLKKKLQDAIGSFTKKAEKEAEVVVEQKPEEKPVSVPEIKKEEKTKVPKEKGKHEIKKKTADEKKHKKDKQEKKGHKEPSKELRVKEKPQEVIEKKEEIKPEIIPEEIPAVIEKHEDKRGFFGKLFGRKEPDQKAPIDTVKEPEQKIHVEEEKPKTIFDKISDSFTKVTFSESKFDELFWDLEVTLLENNVAVEVIDKIKQDLKHELVGKNIHRNDLDKKIISSLRHSVEGLFNEEKIDLIRESKKKKPYVIVIIGVNGSGKTTSIAKLVSLFKKNNLECVIGACDTFRAAAIQQLEEHADNLGVKIIKHDYGSDPAAVAFDAIEHARAKNKDVVLIDTAGRLHSNSNLMAELEKVIRIAKPDLKIFIGESIAGNDVVEQVKLFNEKVGIDAIILSKADVDEKGGAAISVSYVTGKPIIYLGTGQGYDDLVEFDKHKIIEQIGL